jgi:hypothetical protein
MNKTIKIYIGLLILLFIGAIAIEFSKPKPINWTRTFNETHTIPYGTFVLYNELTQLFPESKVQDIAVSPYEYFDDYFNWQDSTYLTTRSYMFIDDYAEVDDISAQELLDFASHGNTIFMSSNTLPKKFLDSLGITLSNDFDFTGKAEFRLANSVFQKDSITIDRGLSNIYFSELDSTRTTILGYQKFNIKERINFVKIDHINGEIYLHLQPVAFTNYSLLKKDNKKYAAAILSYLPDDTIFYDSRNKKRTALGDSPLRFILSQPALKWAWLIGLVALLIFILFNAKRKQRIVKVIKPLENSTIAFTKTIGNLYYETKDHNNLIDKKITYFLESIRRKYFLDTQLLDEKFVKNLALKAGKEKTKTQKTMNLIVHLKAKQSCNDDDLKRLNKTIEDFYNN